MDIFRMNGTGAKRFFVGVFLAVMALGLAVPAYAWDPDTEPPTDLVSIKDKCTRLKIATLALPMTIVKRYNVCLSACTALDPSSNPKDWEDSCCFLTSVVADIAAPLGDEDIKAKIQELMSSVTLKPSVAALEKKCADVRKGTGTGSCVDRQARPDNLPNCCIKEKQPEATIVVDVNGKACPVTKYEGSPQCEANGTFACCICKNADDGGATPTRVRIGSPTGGDYNCQTCAAACSSAPGLQNGVPDFDLLPYKACVTSGASGGGNSVSATGSGNKKYRAYEAQDMFCFTQAECAEAAGSVENFKPGNGCPNKGKSIRGYCRAPEPDWKLQYPVGGVTNVTGLRNLIGLLFNVGIGLIVVAAAAMFVWGAFKYMVSGISSQISSGKDTMIDAAAGMVLGLGAYAILSNVAPNTLQLKPYDLNMINRSTFYDVVMCKSITPVEQQKFGLAGEPEDPRPFGDMLSKEGFDKTFKQTQCGMEYFIEGSDSQAVCKGESCPSGGICVNCASGMAISCKTRSANEYKCADCKIGGNVLTSERWTPNTSWAYLFCAKPSGNSVEVDAEELAKATIPHDSDENSVASASASGWVTNICMKKFDMSAEEIKMFGKDCTAKGGKSGMVMLLFLDKDLTADVSGLQTISEDIKSDPWQYMIRSGLVFGPANPLTGFYDSQADNIYLFQTKSTCEKNLYGKTVPFNQGFFDSVTSFESTVLEDSLKGFHDLPDLRKFYDYLLKDAWTMDEAAAMVENGMAEGCGFSYSP